MAEGANNKGNPRQEGSGSSPEVQSLIPIPPKREMNRNLQTKWEKFKRTWANYEIASALNTKGNRLRGATFLTCIGSEAIELYEGFEFRDGEQDAIDQVIEKFETYCLEKTNESYERYIFNSCTEGDLSFDAYLAKLRQLAKTCEYSALLDDLLKDRIVVEINDNSLRKQFLQEDKLTLKKATDMCRAAQSTTAKLKTITGVHAASEDATVNAVKIKNKEQKCKYGGKQCQNGKDPAFG